MEDINKRKQGALAIRVSVYVLFSYTFIQHITIRQQYLFNFSI